jgi:hypothetical protein
MEPRKSAWIRVLMHTKSDPEIFQKFKKNIDYMSGF